jgi:hypothetical protein
VPAAALSASLAGGPWTGRTNPLVRVIFRRRRRRRRRDRLLHCLHKQLSGGGGPALLAKDRGGAAGGAAEVATIVAAACAADVVLEAAGGSGQAAALLVSRPLHRWRHVRLVRVDRELEPVTVGGCRARAVTVVRDEAERGRPGWPVPVNCPGVTRGTVTWTRYDYDYDAQYFMMSRSATMHFNQISRIVSRTVSNLRLQAGNLPTVSIS